MQMASSETDVSDKQVKPMREKRGVPGGLWLGCEDCGEMIFRQEVERQMNVCPECGYHMYLSARGRIAAVLDEGTFAEWDGDLAPTDPLNFEDKKKYKDRLAAEQKKTGLSDAVLTGSGMIRARRVALGVTDSQFIMGSMGSVVGERLTRLIERATDQQLPLIIISGSGGGARMHEGIFSLMQMAKVSAALARYGGRQRVIHFGPHQSHDGWRGGQFCLAGGYYLCGAQGSHWLRWAPHHQSHDSNRIASGFSNERILAGTWLYRPYRPTSRSQKRNCSRHRLLWKVVGVTTLSCPPVPASLD